MLVRLTLLTRDLVDHPQQEPSGAFSERSTKWNPVVFRRIFGSEDFRILRIPAGFLEGSHGGKAVRNPVVISNKIIERIQKKRLLEIKIEI